MMSPAEQRAMQKHEGRGLRRALVVVAVSLGTDRD
jgi:hypothetical protein